MHWWLKKWWCNVKIAFAQIEELVMRRWLLSRWGMQLIGVGVSMWCRESSLKQTNNSRLILSQRAMKTSERHRMWSRRPSALIYNLCFQKTKVWLLIDLAGSSGTRMKSVVVSHLCWIDFKKGSGCRDAKIQSTSFSDDPMVQLCCSCFQTSRTFKNVARDPFGIPMTFARPTHISCLLTGSPILFATKLSNQWESS